MSERSPSVESIGAQCFIMAGGNGTRLGPLTNDVPKPLLALGTENRLIDPAVVECRQVASSLLIASRNFNQITEYVAERYGGTFQRARETSHRGHGYVLLENKEAIGGDSSECVIVTPADHLRNFDLAAALHSHAASAADLTIVSKELKGKQLAGNDMLELQADGQVSGFKTRQGQNEAEEAGEVSLGTYIFRKEPLLRCLATMPALFPEFCDVGLHLLPQFFQAQTVCNFSVPGQWQDMGTIRRYYDGTMLILENAPSDTFPSVAATAVERNGSLSLISPSAAVADSACIEQSVIGAGASIEEDAVVRNAIIMPRAMVAAGTFLGSAIVAEQIRVGPHTLGCMLEDIQVFHEEGI